MVEIATIKAKRKQNQCSFCGQGFLRISDTGGLITEFHYTCACENTITYVRPKPFPVLHAPVFPPTLKGATQTIERGKLNILFYLETRNSLSFNLSFLVHIKRLGELMEAYNKKWQSLLNGHRL